VATPLGEYLVRRRRELGMDRKTLAALSGLSYPYVSQLETSQDKRPSEKALRLLAPALEVELDELLEVADGWTSGSLTTPPNRVRSLRPRGSTPCSRSPSPRARRGAPRTASW
jgi:transcriptional regulator with XRE-family HTH domain